MLKNIYTLSYATHVILRPVINRLLLLWYMLSVTHVTLQVRLTISLVVFMCCILLPSHIFVPLSKGLQLYSVHVDWWSLLFSDASISAKLLSLSRKEHVAWLSLPHRVFRSHRLTWILYTTVRFDLSAKLDPLSFLFLLGPLGIFASLGFSLWPCSGFIAPFLWAHLHPG